MAGVRSTSPVGSISFRPWSATESIRSRLARRERLGGAGCLRFAVRRCCLDAFLGMFNSCEVERIRYNGQVVKVSAGGSWLDEKDLPI
ncbi:MAG: hypothetical protein KatS3mg077_1184 [Candidatus Binatia bacterium]|nr:MAG: hypothetical protein KatS3mg077_1184 [Candidatus Binatia bacterium]